MTSSNGTHTLPWETGSGDTLVSLETGSLMGRTFLCFCCGGIGVIGAAANIVNIIVFLKQDCTDSVTVSFLGLAVSDLISLLSLVWLSICFNPWFANLDLPFESYEVQYITAGMPRAYLARVTCWITAFITFERCLCIAIPLKVKIITKTSRTIIVILTIYFIMIISVVPVFIYTNLGPKFFYQRNKTLIALVYNNLLLSEQVEDVSSSFTVFSMVFSFIIVTICSVILVQNLLRNSQWRRQSTSVSFSGSSDRVSFRDRKVVLTVAIIAVIFIVCYLPSTVNIVMMVVFSSEYSITGSYQNTLQATWAVFNMLEGINSSVGIIVYLNTSTKYRAVFKQLFYISLSKWPALWRRGYECSS